MKSNLLYLQLTSPYPVFRRRGMSISFIAVVSLLLICYPGSGQDSVSQFGTSAYFTYKTPVIDGNVDSAFTQGTAFRNFRQVDLQIGQASGVKTEIFMMYDHENIYVAGILHQPKNEISTSAGKRDAMILADGDYITLIFDPLNNGNSANFFHINPSNGNMDGILSSNNWDFKWDAVFNSATKIFDDKWTFEFKLPLHSLSFQNKKEQTWGVLFMRQFAKRQDRSISWMMDKNNPFRIADFQKVSGFRNLRQKRTLVATPYYFSSYSKDLVTGRSVLSGKGGGEIRYRPIPSLTIIGTVNPDFAQIESDAVIINVSDVPVSYPERRPFFTESIDMYPGLAVNTRNIKDLKAGVKVRQVMNGFKYDVTWVNDKLSNNWGLANLRWSNNRTFHAEVIAGGRNDGKRTDYNVTTHLRGWAFKRRLTFYNWFGTINRPHHANEFETVTSVKWVTTEHDAGVWSHVKSPLYNPNIIGHNTLSNEININGWFYYTFYGKTSIIKKFIAGGKTDYFDLHSSRGNGYLTVVPGLRMLLHLGKAIGNSEFFFSYRAGVKNNFRYRNVAGVPLNMTYQDAFSRFVLVNQSRGSVNLQLTSDPTRRLGVSIKYNNSEVRRSRTDNMQVDLFWKLTANSNISYSLQYLKLYGSPWQERSSQVFHRLKAEHNFTERFNLRAIWQLNQAVFPILDAQQHSPVLNVTASWEYISGSFAYLVFNKFLQSNRLSGQPDWVKVVDDQVVVLKITKAVKI